MQDLDHGLLGTRRASTCRATPTPPPPPSGAPAATAAAGDDDRASRPGTSSSGHRTRRGDARPRVVPRPARAAPDDAGRAGGRRAAARAQRRPAAPHRPRRPRRPRLRGGVRDRPAAGAVAALRRVGAAAVPRPSSSARSGCASWSTRFVPFDGLLDQPDASLSRLVLAHLVEALATRDRRSPSGPPRPVGRPRPADAGPRRPGPDRGGRARPRPRRRAQGRRTRSGMEAALAATTVPVGRRESETVDELTVRIDGAAARDPARAGPCGHRRWPRDRWRAASASRIRRGRRGRSRRRRTCSTT